MTKKAKPYVKRVFFNASVILAALKSPIGGSGKLLLWCKQQKITGMISEIVFDEIIRNAPKLNISQERVNQKIKESLFTVEPAPGKKTVEKFQSVVIDPGDAHILASCLEQKVDYLVTLDKKHLLILQNKLKWLKIMSPGQLIEKFVC